MMEFGEDPLCGFAPPIPCYHGSGCLIVLSLDRLRRFPDALPISAEYSFITFVRRKLEP